MALKDAGVTRARLGDAEFEFPAPQPEQVIERRVEIMPTPQLAARAPEPKTVGYAALFGEHAPKFQPNTK